MDNYSILLDEFHINKQKLNTTHQFMMIVSEIQNGKLFKNIIKQRKRAMFMELQRNEQKCSQCQHTQYNDLKELQNEQIVSQINNKVLKDELQNMKKQVDNIKKKIKEIDNQMIIYSNKQNQISQFKYQSKRNLNLIEIEIKNQKIKNQSYQTKNYQFIQKLNLNLYHLLQSNLFLAQQINVKQYDQNAYGKKDISLSRIMEATYMTECELSNLQTTKRSQLSNENSLNKLQQQMKVLHTLLTLKQTWQQIKQFGIINSKIQTDLSKSQQFSSKSNTQILQYYLNQFKINNIQQVVSCIMCLFQQMKNNIKLLQSNGDCLNYKIKQLRDQYEELIKIYNNIQETNNKNVMDSINMIQQQNQFKNNQIKIKCRSILQIIQKFVQLSNKFQRLKATLNNLIAGGDSQEISGNFSGYQRKGKKLSVLRSSVEKKNSQILSKKNSFISPQGCNVSPHDENQKPSKASLMNILLKLPTMNKKHPQQNIRKLKTLTQQIDSSKKENNIISQYSQMMYRDPKQLVTSFHYSRQNCRDKINLVDMIMENDLYRVFYQPSSCVSEHDQIANEQIYKNNIWQKVGTTLKNLKLYIVQYIKSTLIQINKISKKKSFIFSNCNSKFQQKFVVEKKDVNLIDDFCLEQKFDMSEEINQLYNLRTDADNQQRYPWKKQFNIKKNGLSRRLQNRQPRKTTPNVSNYLSVYRERVGKANRKIRDLLKNASVIRIRKKTSPQINSLHKKKG